MEDYQNYIQQSDSNYKLEFEIDMALINILRSFEHQNHEFKEGYLESIYALLYYYQGKPETELFSEFSTKNGGHSLEALIFSVHFYLGSMAILDGLLKVLGVSMKVIPMAKSDLNKTNILTVHAITDRIGKIDHSLLVKKSKELKPQYLENFKVCITSNEKQIETKSDRVLYLDYHKIDLAIKAKGKLDPFASSYIAHILNEQYSLDLFHVLLSFVKDKKQATQNYSNQFLEIFKSVRELNFDKVRYQTQRSKLIQFYESDSNSYDEIQKFLIDLENDVGRSIIARDPVSNHYLEKLLIGMLGHPLLPVRDQAVVLLNVLYDGVDWQKRSSHKPRILRVGSQFKIEYLFEHDELSNLNSVVLLLKSFIFDQKCQQNVISWHRPRLTEYRSSSVEGTGKQYLVFSMDFGRFRRCGIYDWKLIRLTQNGKLNSVYKIMNLEGAMMSSNNLQHQLQQFQESKPIQGRFIVQPGDSRELQLHEIYVDLLDAKPDKQGKFTKRGNFRKVKDRLPDLYQSGINCLYLMGALERDNGFHMDNSTQLRQFKRPDASPLAITSRTGVCSMLGGSEGFSELMIKANELGVKILVDGITRVSASRPHQKYKKYLLNKLDDNGRLVPLFGAEGRALNFEDTAILNYRKQSAWDLFLNELIQLREQYLFHGVHLDNCQTQPQIFTLNIEELLRKDADGQSAYSQKQIFEGNVVYHNEDCGYWGSRAKDKYPNPFLIKMCKRLWERYPDFLIIGEAWGFTQHDSKRETNLIQSGIIPRSFKMPIVISSVLGQQLSLDGSLNYMEPQNVYVIRKLLENNKKNYPRGSIVVQSTTYHSWPYPALLYKRGTWAAIDLFFLLQDIPMTFMAEQDGHAFREKTTRVFTYQALQQSPLIQEQSPNKIQRIDSQLKLSRSDSFIEGELGFGFNTYSQFMKPEELKRVNSSQNVVRVQSGTSLSEMEIGSIQGAHENFWREVGPDYGFDLKQIGKHYNHRRKLRQQHRVLRRGQLIPLAAEHQYGWHTHVLAFCRYTKKELALTAINFNDASVDLFLNLKNLRNYFTNYETSNIVLKLMDWTTIKPQEVQYYYVGELINEHLYVSLKSFQTQIWGVQVLDGNKDNQALVYKSSLQRLINSVNSQIPSTIWSNNFAQMLVSLARTTSLQSFINGFLWFRTNVLRPNKINLNKLLSMMIAFTSDRALLCRLFAMIQGTINKLEEAGDTFRDCQEELIDVRNENKLGPICFTCPELGKWTTTGGLGVMVDELTQELAKMNEEVLVITPYYDRNKQGKTGYLEADGFKYKQSIYVWAQNVKYEIGVHEGEYNKVKIYWLHNPEIFPTAYCGEDPKYVMKQLTVYGKACLELLCQLQVIPAVIVTNDWFCGLIPAYVKDPRFFGQTFSGTKCFHIAHNLDPLYEGRLYPDYNLYDIHEVSPDDLIDPFWEKIVVNPSRCALRKCDNWGTVSNSYKYELLEKSPLSPVLRAYPQPFAFPNGIRREARFKIIMDKTQNDHLAAKEILQKKYFRCDKLRSDIPVFGFVGRITKQKGVHLICEVADELIQRLHGQIQILVGGPADMREQYSAECANQLYRLKNQYPYNFWADPNAFFYDGTVVNVGCDFALMPSMFEPGGIVQHEFFIGSTPVVAFKTGGLRDTVHEYDRKTQKGSGFTFEQYSRNDFLNAIERAISVFKEQQHYDKLRKNSFEAAIDVADVGRAWAQEFYRMYKKNFIDKELVAEHLKKIDLSFNLRELKEDGSKFNKIDGRAITSKDDSIKNFERILTAAKRTNFRQHHFYYKTNQIPQPRQVLLQGSFDEWKEKHKLKFDHFSKTWGISLQLQPGEYFYKFNIGNDWFCSDDDPKDTDNHGNINNIVLIE